MRGYRLYFQNRDGRTARGVVFSSRDDDEAVRIAASYATGAAMELWQDERLVKAYPATDQNMTPVGWVKEPVAADERHKAG